MAPIFSLRLLFAVTIVFFALATRLAAQPSTPADYSRFSADELVAEADRLSSSGDPAGAVPQLVEAWLQAHDTDGLSLEQTQWCLRHALPHKTQRTAFSVVWTGFLTPPRSGNYAFSVSPINVNKSFGGDHVRHSISVSIAGKTIIDAGPKKDSSTTQPAGRRGPAPIAAAPEWQWKDGAIALEAGQAVPIRVAMDYECREPNYGDSPSAILFWEAPGMERRPVESSFLTTPERSANGLRSEYRFVENGQVATVVQRSPNVEFAWALPGDVAPHNPELVNRLTGRLWQLCIEPEYIAKCAAGRATHKYFQDYSSTEYLSTLQRRHFLRLVQSTPELLGRANDQQLLLLYRSLRFGAEEEALDMVGQWMQLKADIKPEIAADFFRENRKSFAELAVHIARQLPEEYRVLQNRYLEMPDGRCCLPVAYTLSYSYRSLPTILPSPDDAKPAESPFRAWSALLDVKLDDKSITGNDRVNWLIAKAQSVEPRGQAISGSSRPQEYYLAGMNWLTEAHLEAEDDVTRTRIYAEEVARAATLNRGPQVKELLQAAAGTVPAQVLKTWIAAAEAIAQKWQDRRMVDSQLARAAYIKVLQRRRERAANTNDDQAVARYDMLLERAGADTE